MKEAAIRFRKERLFLLPRVGEKRWINSSAKRRELPIPAATAVSDRIAGSSVLRQAAMISLPNLSRLPRQEYRDL